LILLDASGLFAAFDTDAREHEAARRSLLASQPFRLLSPFVLAELDYLIEKRLGRVVRSSFLEEVSLGAYRLTPWAADDVAEARAVVMRYADLGVSLADASIVVLAHRYDVKDVLTLDQRHFRVLQGPEGPFRLLPADV
jgi:predicted nucleic acid-binding protein